MARRMTRPTMNTFASPAGHRNDLALPRTMAPMYARPTPPLLSSHIVPSLSPLTYEKRDDLLGPSSIPMA